MPDAPNLDPIDETVFQNLPKRRPKEGSELLDKVPVSENFKSWIGAVPTVLFIAFGFTYLNYSSSHYDGLAGFIILFLTVINFLVGIGVLLLIALFRVCGVITLTDTKIIFGTIFGCLDLLVSSGFGWLIYSMRNFHL